MNVRKLIDYSAMFAALEDLVAANLPQMELYRDIGRLVSGRPEKGAAVAAAEYLHDVHPDTAGFSPRNVRRMRDFCHTYESAPEIMAEAMTISWTRNVVILDAELTLQEKAWYIRAVQRFGWSKLELAKRIASAAHLEIPLVLPEKVCCTGENTGSESVNDDENPLYEHISEPNGRICNEKSGEENRAGSSTSHRVCNHEHQGDWQPAPSPSPQKTDRARDRLYGQNCAATQEQQLQRIQFTHWDERIDLRNIHRICSGDYTGKTCLLMDYTDHSGDAAEPQHTNDFKTTWRDVLLCYGGSDTYGYDTRSYWGRRYPKSACWTGLLEAAG